ncbi:MAG TPA: hypothetical protein VJU86_01405 [Pyrinomonadaceae bacterium]|nr:hypothetical protein [Pyrinomonadaceae bacterium]
MGRQDTENLFRRYKNQLTHIKTKSGATYKGKIVEITNDYVALSNDDSDNSTFVLFNAIESVVVDDEPPTP